MEAGEFDGNQWFFRRFFSKDYAATTGRIRPMAFRPNQGATSVDYSGLCTPEFTRDFPCGRAGAGVAKVQVAPTLKIPGLKAVHTPDAGAENIPPNPAHCDLFGTSDQEVKLELSRLASVAFAPTD